MHRPHTPAAPRSRRSGPWLALGALLTVGLAAPITLALQGMDQPAAGLEAAQEPQSKFPIGIEDASPALRAHVADQMVRAARRRLLVQQDPQPVEYRLAAEMFAAARSLVPPDAELIRLEIEARTAGLQSERVIGLTRELLAIEPDDEIAQLRLAVHTVKQRQTAEERLQAYEVLLGPKGEALRRAVRSRLAVDAALLARERGSERLFIDYITFATTLDPSNKEAAALYASHFLAILEDPVERADVLTNVVLSDPLDPEAMQNLALELVQHGAYRGAYELLNHTVRLYSQRRERLPLRLRIEITLAEWNTQGTQHLIDYSQGLEDILIQSIKGEREFAIAQGLDPGPEREALLPLELEALRLAAAVTRRDQELADRMLGRILRLGAQAFQNFSGMDADPEVIQRRIDALRLTLLWCRLFGAGDFEGVRSELEYFSDPDNPNALQQRAQDRFYGWLAVHEGENDRARELLEPIYESDRHARWAMAVLSEKEGDTRTALSHYAHIAQRYPNTAIGTAAWFRTKDLYEGDLVRSPAAEELSDEGVRLVEWLEALFPDASGYMSITVTQVTNPVDPVGPAELEIKVRNRSDWPLAVGQGRPVPSRILATPIFSFGIRDLVDATRPESLTLPGRLRLEGGEERSFRVRINRRLVGDLHDFGAVRRSTARWQTTLGFAHDGERPVPTPFSVSAQTGLATVRSLPADAPADALFETIDKASGIGRAGATRAAALALSRLVMGQLGFDAGVVEQRRAILLNGLASRLGEFEELERAAALVALSMPLSRVGGEEMLPLQAALDGDPSPYVAAIIATTAVVSSLDSPVYTTLRDSDLRWARDMAQHVADAVRLSEAVQRSNAQNTGG